MMGRIWLEYSWDVRVLRDLGELLLVDLVVDSDTDHGTSSRWTTSVSVLVGFGMLCVSDWRYEQTPPCSIREHCLF